MRDSHISTSISEALAAPPAPTSPASLLRRLLASLLTFLSLFRLPLARFRPDLFLALRRDAWRLDEAEYLAAFAAPPLGPDIAATTATTIARATTTSSTTTPKAGAGRAAAARQRRPLRELVPIGDLGYSGSTFFATPDGKFLVKSLPRRFEHRFFVDDLLEPYAAHMRERPDSLLVRITDLVRARRATLGGVLGLAPTHHIIMENLLYGKGATTDAKPDDHDNARSEADDGKASADSEASTGGDGDGDGDGNGWETYDLKPDSYFFPERDLAGGRLAPESVKERLAGSFPSTIPVATARKAQLMRILEADTRLLAANRAVDYSLFLVRYPAATAATATATSSSPSSATSPSANPPPSPPSLDCDAHPWRRGVTDADGRWTYRVVVLDFFWPKHKLRVRALTALVGALDKVAGTGPMSITADPAEYRARFMRMVDGMVVAVDNDDDDDDDDDDEDDDDDGDDGDGGEAADAHEKRG